MLKSPFRAGVAHLLVGVVELEINVTNLCSKMHQLSRVQILAIITILDIKDKIGRLHRIFARTKTLVNFLLKAIETDEKKRVSRTIRLVRILGQIEVSAIPNQQPDRTCITRLTKLLAESSVDFKTATEVGISFSVESSVQLVETIQSLRIKRKKRTKIRKGIAICLTLTLVYLVFIYPIIISTSVNEIYSNFVTLGSLIFPVLEILGFVSMWYTDYGYGRIDELCDIIEMLLSTTTDLTIPEIPSSKRPSTIAKDEFELSRGGTLAKIREVFTDDKWAIEIDYKLTIHLGLVRRYDARLTRSVVLSNGPFSAIDYRILIRCFLPSISDSICISFENESRKDYDCFANFVDAYVDRGERARSYSSPIEWASVRSLFWETDASSKHSIICGGIDEEVMNECIDQSMEDYSFERHNIYYWEQHEKEIASLRKMRSHIIAPSKPRFFRICPIIIFAGSLSEQYIDSSKRRRARLIDNIVFRRQGQCTTIVTEKYLPKIMKKVESEIETLAEWLENRTQEKV
jgi:hypothetical protein